jgi:hypothetical protein
MENRIVEAVGLGYKPGPVGFKKRIVRGVMRGFVWALHRGIIPLAARQAAMFGVLNFRSKLMRVPFLSGASIGDTFENDLMKLIFNATAIANVADNASSSPLTNLSVALHTADPGETGTQSTSEATYTSYARVSVARSGSGWTVTANSVSPVSSISFPAGTGGSGTVTHFSVGPTGGGATKIFFSGTVSPNIVTGNGITPVLTTATAITID